jgi:hypothetical protein
VGTGIWSRASGRCTPDRLVVVSLFDVFLFEIETHLFR